MTPFKYVHFINHSEKVWDGLPYRERQILCAVLQHDAQTKQNITVLIQRSEFGSQATLHAAVQRLIRADLLTTTSPITNTRAKYVSLTTKSNNLFKKLEKVLEKSAKAQ